MNILAVLMALACFTGLGGCAGDEARGNEKDPVPHLSFEMPLAWEVEYNDLGSAHRAMKYELATRNGVTYRTDIHDDPQGNQSPFSLFEIYEVKKGDEAAAKEKTLSDNPGNYQYSETTLGGEMVYLLQGEEESFTDEPWVGTIGAFEKDGWVIYFNLTDSMGPHRETLTMMIETMSITLK